jgi:uncharacterized lipoprotein YddW (UPF0748 family)
MRLTNIFSALTVASCSLAGSLQALTYEPATVTLPKPRREFRGAWVATVKNIDWPSKPGLSTAEQKRELLAILDRAAQLRLNAIIFQVRPMCDAFYASPLEPWSPYLTGKMGRPPQPFYDPLEFAVAEAHKRGLELHAWFNPYRALVKSPSFEPSANHVSRRYPELVRDYGSYLWLDPGEKQVQDYSLSVVMDVVRRYDVDGVHLDDYFYPYPEKGRDGANLDFPDTASWKKFGAGGRLNRDDWRRENVNRFIERLHQSVKAAKPWVKFGVSPFGIWRPGTPRPIQGFDAYAQLYADSRLWLVNGWVDYFAPQLYWRIDPPEQSFPVLLAWWAEQNKRGRQLWVGMSTANTVSRNRAWPSNEIVRQIEIARRQSGVSGHVHWNMRALLRNETLAGELARGLYAEAALVPACAAETQPSLSRPSVILSGLKTGTLRIGADPMPGDTVRHWVLQTETDGKWQTEILPGDSLRRTIGHDHPGVIAVTPVDRYGHTGPAVILRKQ